ncbi:hypothetical protein [Frigidibacter sp. ROC022]|uniref:hypothetical protein n=1 Tax=Frigidibacter sp. ROC022 TaxID=2971796 RepID=UPI00215B4DF8|nr:hypothetical protein [Frigidibacter sp. ROC022]MCR8725020.1 hypothetical protein [Frigidibacter sp. ROC022]
MSQDRDDDKDLHRIERKLTRLASAPGPIMAEGRLVGSGTGLLAALLNEIDETVLARRLGFTTDTGLRLFCDVYGRRLLALRPPVPEGVETLPGAETLIDKPLGALDAQGMAQLRTIFETVLNGATRLFASSSELPGGRNPAVLGTAASTLAAAWDLTLDAAPPAGPPLELFHSAAAPLALAWLQVSDKTADKWGGAQDGVARLTRFAAETRANLLAPDPDPTAGPRFTVLSRQGDSGNLIIAQDGPTALVLLVPAERLPQITDAWRAVAG